MYDNSATGLDYRISAYFMKLMCHINLNKKNEENKVISNIKMSSTVLKRTEQS